MILLHKKDNQYKEIIDLWHNLYIWLNDLEIKKNILNKKWLDEDIEKFLESNQFNILILLKKKDEIFLDWLTSIFFRSINKIVFLRDNFNDNIKIKNIIFIQEKRFSKYIELYDEKYVQFWSKKFYKLKKMIWYYLGNDKYI